MGLDHCGPFLCLTTHISGHVQFPGRSHDQLWKLRFALMFSLYAHSHQLTRPPHGRLDQYECVQHFVTTRHRHSGVLLLKEAPADELWRINRLKKTTSVKWRKSVCCLQVKCRQLCSYIQDLLFRLCVLFSFIHFLFLPCLSLLKFLSCGELPTPFTVGRRWQWTHHKLYPNWCFLTSQRMTTARRCLQIQTRQNERNHEYRAFLRVYK